MTEQLPPEIMQKAVKGLSYIAHPLRLRILEYLDVNGRSSVSQIAKAVDEDQVIVSQSLRKMRDARLVRTKRKGIFVYYGICEEYPASLFVCMRKLYGVMTDSFEYCLDGCKKILPRDYTTLAAGRIKLFAHYDKMRILEYLTLFGESNVGDIAAGVGLEPLKVSQFLKKMKEDEFVACRRDGRFVFYAVLKGIPKTAVLCIRKRYDSLTDKSLF